MESKLYGVSSGNGNNGVSHMFPDYYVRTSEPYRLAELAVLSTFKAGSGMAWAQRHLEVDGEAEFTVSASIDAPPCDDTEDGEYPDPGFVCTHCGQEASEEGANIECDCGKGEWEARNGEDMEDGRNWVDNNGCWLIVEVFPITEEPQLNRPLFESLEEAFSAPELELVPADKA